MPCFRTIFFFFLTSGLAVAEDWPQWLGPRRDGSSQENIAPWKEAPKVLWRKPVGEGHGSPVVAGGRVFLFTRVRDTNKEELAAFDADSGMPLWKKDYERAAFKSLFGNGPRGTPTVVQGRVYTFGITGVLTCFNVQTGNILWQVDTLKEFKAPNLFFGASCSPLAAGERVLVNVGGKGASIVAFDATNGKVLWKALDDKASYSSPILTGEGEDQQAVFLTGQNLVGLSPGDGKLLWQFPLVDKLSESSTTPVIVGDLLFGSSVTYGGVALKREKAGGAFKASQVWMKPELTCYFSTPVPVGKDHLYMVTGAIALKPQATLHCIEAKSGQELWQKPKVGTYHASLLRTGDNKLLLMEEGGSAVLLDANPKEYRELARAKICGNTWAHPALANGKLYIRDEKELTCIQLGN